MSQSYGVIPDKADMIPVLQAAVDRGVTFFDTAQVYGPFVNEELVGEALASVRTRVIIATKFGLGVDANGGQVQDSRPETIRESAGGSLRRLRTDHIDLLYQHRVEKLARIEENVGATAVELTAEDLQEIEEAASRIQIQGARYPEALEARTGL